MEKRTYKQPPIDEMYISVHFQSNPSVGSLDFYEFSNNTEKDFTDKKYIFPVIESVGNMNKITTEPDKIWFHKENSTQILQFGKDRMVYNWRAGANQPVVYPKYEKVKSEFLKYWKELSNYIKKYKGRKLQVTACELYYSNILHIGEDHFLKNDTDLHQALSFISLYPKEYKTVIPHIDLQIPATHGDIFLKLEKIKNNTEKKEAFLLILSKRNKTNIDDIDLNWYDEANKNIRQFFEKITTEEIRNFWKR